MSTIDDFINSYSNYIKFLTALKEYYKQYHITAYYTPNEGKVVEIYIDGIKFNFDYSDDIDPNELFELAIKRINSLINIRNIIMSTIICKFHMDDDVPMKFYLDNSKYCFISVYGSNGMFIRTFRGGIDKIFTNIDEYMPYLIEYMNNNNLSQYLKSQDIKIVLK
jgi:hypothetical protein